MKNSVQYSQSSWDFWYYCTTTFSYVLSHKQAFSTVLPVLSSKVFLISQVVTLRWSSCFLYFFFHSSDRQTENVITPRRREVTMWSMSIVQYSVVQQAKCHCKFLYPSFGFIWQKFKWLKLLEWLNYYMRIKEQSYPGFLYKVGNRFKSFTEQIHRMSE